MQMKLPLKLASVNMTQPTDWVQINKALLLVQKQGNKYIAIQVSSVYFSVDLITNRLKYFIQHSCSDPNNHYNLHQKATTTSD
jgi:hypothetical protein